MSEEFAKPYCPKCEIRGKEYIVFDDSTQEHVSGRPWFNISFCKNCGHVYGVFAKTVLSPPTPMPSMPGFGGSK